MEKDLKELIRKNKNDLQRYINKKDFLRNKIDFCSIHNFEEEVRVANINLSAIDGIVYDYQQFIKDLEIIIKSYENSSKQTE